MKRAEWIWLDGAYVPWEEATTHVLSHSLHYGIAVFEGIRCYETADGPAVVRLREHLERLALSGKIVCFDLGLSVDALEELCLELIRKNGHRACYIRPIAFLGSAKVGLDPTGADVHLAIITWEWGAYLGDEGLRRGIRCRVSSFTRLHPNVLMTKAKCSGNYANSQLARLEAVREGYDEAIMLDPDGYAVEGSGENLFIVERGRLVCPPLGSALDGITRRAILELARDEGLETREERVTRDRVYTADEVFLTGTAAEVTPVREIDRRVIGAGERGPITARLQEAYRRAVRGEDPRYEGWLTRVG